MKTYRTLGVAVAAAMSLGASLANALPDARSGNPLPTLGIATPNGIGDVIRDHEKSNTLYVAPANVKTIQGSFSQISGTGTSCSNYVNLRSQTYRLPASSSEAESVYRNHSFFSNLYQITYAIPRANQSILKSLIEARLRFGTANPENDTRFERYFILNAKWVALTTEIAKWESDKAKASSDLTTKMAFCTTIADPAKCINDAVSEFTRTVTAVDQKLSQLRAEKSTIADAYFTEKGKYDNAQQQLTNITNDMQFFTTIYQSQVQISKNAWDIERTLEKEEGNKIVGRATAGYNVYNNEAQILSNAVRHRSGFQVKQLDLFNIRLAPSVRLDNVVVQDGQSGESIYTLNTWSFPSDSLVRGGVLKDFSLPFEKPLEGDNIRINTLDTSSFGSGSFETFVIKSARCGEEQKSVRKHYTFDGRPGVTVVLDQYVPNGNKKVFTQSIGLDYNYYAYPGPLRGQCSINVDRMSSYWRNAGRKTSWSWFRKKTTTWDNTKQFARDNMGIECSLSVNPQSEDPVQAAELKKAFEQNLYNDMWQMFIAVYAKEYTVEPLDPTIIDPGKSTVGTTLGTGLMKICGANIYCAIGGIVLKTLDEIGGSKAQGTTSAQSTHYGTIRKRYSEDSFMMKGGRATINLEVKI